MNRKPLVTLTTDFGLRDAYVAVMKGVILGIAPDATIVDISHDVTPQNIAEAAYLLATAYRSFPAAAIHVAVVDPGVGTTRKPLAIGLPHGVFVGPDNGIFSGVLLDQDAVELPGGRLRRGQAVELANEEYWRRPVSTTFHGRDIFAPSAAHLASGTPLSHLGPNLAAVYQDSRGEPSTEAGSVRGTIVHIDRFGNAISNVPATMVPPSPVFYISGHALCGLSSTYQEAPLGAIAGSAGLVEIALRNGSAAEHLGIGVGDVLTVRGAS